MALVDVAESEVDIEMADNDCVPSADILEPGELLDSDCEQPDNKWSSARTDLIQPRNRPKVCFAVTRQGARI